MKNKLIKSFFFGVVYFLFLPLTWFTPRNNMDDYSYAFSYKELGRYLVTFNDFVSSMIAHYSERHGRIWTNGLASVFSANDFDWLFKILNAFAFVTLIFLAVKVLEYDKKHKVSVVSYACMALLFWFLIPVPGQTLLWMCGSLNYLWPLVLILFFTRLIQISLTRNVSYFPFCCICSVIIGWQNESLSGPIIGSLFLYYLIKRPVRLPKQTLWLIGCFILGSLLMIFAPATIHRMGNTAFSTNSLALVVLFRIYTLGMLFIGLRIKATMLLMLGLVFLYYKDKLAFRRFIQNNLFLLLVIICSIAAVILVAYVDDRGEMGTEFVAILLLYRLFRVFWEKYKLPISRRTMTVVLLCLGAFFIYDYSYAIKSVYTMYIGDKEIMADYIASEDGVVCSPFEQQDYESRFVSYCNGVEYEKGISMYYSYHLKEWKAFHLIPSSFYKVIKGDIAMSSTLDQVAASDGFYTRPDELYYMTRLEPGKNIEKVTRCYRFNPDSFMRKFFPRTAQLIENFYSNTNIRSIIVYSNGNRYLFVNKLKRMLPGLDLDQLSLKYRDDV